MATQEENFKTLIVIVAVVIVAAMFKCGGGVRSGASANAQGFLLVRAGCRYCAEAKDYIKAKGLHVPMQEAKSADYEKYKVRGVPALIMTGQDPVVGWGEQMQTALQKFK